ncbi:hypothetical protein CYLTODRAFT_491835 [Cylindrobasidium torrendii FP15055 ss-10]|uniref:Uncharacterized protein n=1 Tax=Cylindrobasidium torrendii FP15055 ss-10 TaxID=1314674 RepID=A0A0D7B659_9AGAR|nr:hypothetical protein CYLTODRAFT_491835 [Cylindrobasidium torrendii FP15055 ss-10]
MTHLDNSSSPPCYTPRRPSPLISDVLTSPPSSPPSSPLSTKSPAMAWPARKLLAASPTTPSRPFRRICSDEKLLRQNFQARCLRRAAEAQKEVLGKRKRTLEPIEEDPFLEGPEEARRDTEFYRRVVTHTSKKIRKRTNYYAESVPLDLDELEEWEAELEQAHEQEQPPSDDLDEETLNSYAEQYQDDTWRRLEDDSLWAEFDDEWNEISLPASP